MAITLAEAKVGMADKVDMAVVDAFRRSSVLLDKLTFDNVISPGTGGSTLTYGYVQLKTPSTASGREVGSEYTADEAKKEKKTANAAIMGGSFKVDRVLQNTSGAADEMAFQAEQKIKATASYFHNLAINGTSETGFEGLRTLVFGEPTCVSSQVSIGNAQELDENYNAFLDELDAFLAKLDGKPDMLMMNTQLLIKLRAIARRAGYYERTTDAFGNPVETYAGIPMVDMGKYYNGSSSQDVIVTSEGFTDMYAVCLGLDGFHGISPTGTGVIQSYMPDMNTPGAVKTGEVELVAGVVLKNTAKAGVLHSIYVGE